VRQVNPAQNLFQRVPKKTTRTAVAMSSNASRMERTFASAWHVHEEEEKEMRGMIKRRIG